MKQHLKAVEKDRDEYKVAAEIWHADALRDGAALEKVRELLGTTVVAEKVPEVLENRLQALSQPYRGARALDAVVTHEDLKKLKDEIWDEIIGACESSVAHVEYPGFTEQPYLKLGQIMRRERRRRS